MTSMYYAGGGGDRVVVSLKLALCVVGKQSKIKPRLISDKYFGISSIFDRYSILF